MNIQRYQNSLLPIDLYQKKKKFKEKIWGRKKNSSWEVWDTKETKKKK